MSIILVSLSKSSHYTNAEFFVHTLQVIRLCMHMTEEYITTCNHFASANYFKLCQPFHTNGWAPIEG